MSGFYSEIPIALGSSDHAEKMFTDLCDTGAVCVRILVDLTPDSSLCRTSYLTLQSYNAGFKVI